MKENSEPTGDNKEYIPFPLQSMHSNIVIPTADLEAAVERAMPPDEPSHSIPKDSERGRHLMLELAIPPIRTSLARNLRG